MLFGPVIHPPLLEALARSGHGSMVLLADGNYPYSTAAHPTARTVELNIAPGLLDVDTALGLVRQIIPIEAAAVMVPSPDAPLEHRPQRMEAAEGYRQALRGVPFRELERFGFYALGRADDVSVVIATGDQRPYANLMVTVGVRPPA